MLSCCFTFCRRCFANACRFHHVMAQKRSGYYAATLNSGPARSTSMTSPPSLAAAPSLPMASDWLVLKLKRLSNIKPQYFPSSVQKEELCLPKAGRRKPLHAIADFRIRLQRYSHWFGSPRIDVREFLDERGVIGWHVAYRMWQYYIDIYVRQLVGGSLLDSMHHGLIRLQDDLACCMLFWIRRVGVASGHRSGLLQSAFYFVRIELVERHSFHCRDVELACRIDGSKASSHKVLFWLSGCRGGYDTQNPRS